MTIAFHGLSGRILEVFDYSTAEVEFHGEWIDVPTVSALWLQPNGDVVERAVYLSEVRFTQLAEGEPLWAK